MKFRDYIYTENIKALEFALKADLGIATVYRYMNGKRPTLRIAMKIEKLSEGKVSLKDWGEYE